MKTIITSLLLLFSFGIYCQPQIFEEDLKAIVGSWEGTITYLDYQTNEPFTMPANLIVEKGRGESCLVLKNEYPTEPKANNSDKIKVTKNGTKLNKYLVSKREELDDGEIQIRTEHNGRDDHKRALIRHTYRIGKNLLIIRKEVQFAETIGWIKRSEFNYERNK